jgi:hypothetical protein
VVTGGDANDPPVRAPGAEDAPVGSDPAGSRREGHPPSDDGSTPLTPEETAVLAAFDRLRPQGNLQWCFDDAMRRLDRPDHDSASGALPWPGLPDGFWERGRSARVSRRFMGEVTEALSELLAADARAAADAAVTSLHGERFVAAWDALRFLAARVDALEARLDPIGVVAADLDLELPDTSAWSEQLSEWLGDGLTAVGPLVVGEARDTALVAAATRTGRSVCAVEPRGAVVWETLAAGERHPAALVMAEVGDHLALLGDESVAGVAVAGSVDRIGLVEKVALVGHALRVTRAGGRVVVFATDQTSWDRQLAPTARDLLAGRPLHPDTWSLLLARAGADSVTWHRPPNDGVPHAIVAEVGT